MQLNRDNSPLWMVEFDKQLLRGKHVLLYGNVEDRFLLPESNKIVSLAEFLNRYFCEIDYELVGHYDIVDGIQLADPQQMGPLLDGLANTRAKPPSPASKQPPKRESAPYRESRPQTDTDSEKTPALTLQRQQTTRRTPGRGADDQSRTGEQNRARTNSQTDSRFLSPGAALPVIRRVLTQGRTPSAMMLEFSDKLVSDPQRQDQQERPILVQLKKILDETAELTQGSLSGRRNALVIIASQLAGLPSWFYQDHPLLTLIRIPHPSIHERARFIQKFLPQFEGGEELNEPHCSWISQQFAELTDGLTIWDLMAIGNTSVSEHLAISSSSSLANLISYYKYGEREDPWEKFNEDKVRQAPQLIERRVIGQSKAVEAIVDMLVTARIGITLTQSSGQSGKPKGVFFLL
uniref:Uncharacterized protein n=1 Tax=Candidatus Kentrum sp. MB TaxID=2138164 RepID=A0A450XCT1_9GAMM|nr:MAG: hypothetical protein BECKMB1821G_GA0114241_100918 [Candidatus Kentron sp. MB]VFK27093.1 MAG: hypothetical protein BECKMB1821I_GA0114274_100234 [Candidatus Kentron sp. MB]VFK74910.1 MAG: hypothetical protein BECKMB1821H_GA0114242_101219 [Candidatus Kentron sp. MB]